MSVKPLLYRNRREGIDVGASVGGDTQVRGDSRLGCPASGLRDVGRKLRLSRGQQTVELRSTRQQPGGLCPSMFSLSFAGAVQVPDIIALGDLVPRILLVAATVPRFCPGVVALGETSAAR